MKKKDIGYILIEVLIVITISVLIVQYLLQFVISTQKYVNSNINKDKIFLDQDMIAGIIESQFSKSVSIDEVLTTDGKTIVEIPTSEISIKCIKLSQLDDGSENYNIGFGNVSKFYEVNTFIFLRRDIPTNPICVHKIKSGKDVHCGQVIGKFHYEIGNGVKEMPIKRISEKDFEIGIILENYEETYHFFVSLLE